MLITDFASYEEVRSTLGVTEEELSDATLGLGMYEDVLMSDLEDVALDLPATYATTLAIVTPTDAQARFLRHARAFARYSIARHLTITLPVFSPREVGDGKAVMSRVADPFRETVKAINGEYEKARTRLVAAFEALGSAAEVTTPRVYFSVVSPVSDPITGS